MPLAEGGKASPEGTSMHMYVPPQGQILVLVYWSHINAMLIWGSGTCPQTNFLQPNYLPRHKLPLQKIGEMERVQYEGQFLLLLSPTDKGRGGQLIFLPPSVGVPGSNAKSCT